MHAVFDLKSLKMKLNNPYTITFSGLPVGKHEYVIPITKDFLASQPIEEIENLEGSAQIILEKLNNLMKVYFVISGSYELACDRCNSTFVAPFSVSEEMYLQHGIALSGTSENAIVLPEGVFELDTLPFIYEFIALSIPKRKVHPNNGCDVEVLKKLDALLVSENQVSDPRWNVLKNVKF